MVSWPRVTAQPVTVTNASAVTVMARRVRMFMMNLL
jgi:hypothetical protein